MTDPGKDLPAKPFNTPIYLTNVGNEPAVDSLKTIEAHQQGMFPAIDGTHMIPNDVLEVEFEDSAREVYRIVGVGAEDLSFGSDDVRNPQITVRDEAQENGAELVLMGTSILPNGHMPTPAIKTGSFLITHDRCNHGMNIAPTPVKNFTLRRPNERGELEEVMLNRAETESSQSFSAARSLFRNLEKQLGADGFSFHNKRADGKPQEYIKLFKNTLIYAGHLGFGTAVVPQHEIHVYDARNGVLRSLRSMPTKGIIQAAIVKAPPEVLAYASQAYMERPDWKKTSMIGGTTLGRMSDYAPSITYSWQKPLQENPIITVELGGTGTAGSEVMQGDITKGRGFKPKFARHTASVRIDGSGPIVVSEKRKIPADARAVVEQRGNDIALKLGDHVIHFLANPQGELDKMVGLVSAAVQDPHRALGDRALRWALRGLQKTQ